jgi:hypothetical protein
MGLANNHSFCEANYVDAAWYRSFSGTAQAAKGSSSIFLRNATALIQMGDWCESACADRQPNERNDGCERVEAASTKVSVE